MSKPVFKTYAPQQLMLLPPSLGDLIKDGHPVRVVDKVIEALDLKPVIANYTGGGASSYHPKLMLKVLVYAYLSNIYSSRKIQAALEQNIHFMWLAGMSRPEHNSINRFRSERLKGVLQTVFSQVVMMLAKSGHLSLKETYLDGTKIRANASPYSFVWEKSIKYNKEKIKTQLKELWSYAEQVAKEEMNEMPPLEIEAVDEKTIVQTVQKIDKILTEKPVDKEVKKKLARAKKEWPSRLAKYQEQEAILAGRSSYSKTDTDASFMRTKEDRLGTGQLVPCYNWQISTNGQYILHYSIHQNPADTGTLPVHLEGFKAQYGTVPKVLVADAGYGSEENYELLTKEGIEAYVKYNYFEQETSKKWQSDSFKTANLAYEAAEDKYYCPTGKPMTLVESKNSKTLNGYQQQISVYEAENCEGCPIRKSCHNSKTNRRITINHRLNALRAKARENLLSEKGRYYRSRRSVDVEPVFGAIKHNRGYRRFLLRAKPKVEVEVGLLSMAHNLKKAATKYMRAQA